jgi:hypothetical protein
MNYAGVASIARPDLEIDNLKLVLDEGATGFPVFAAPFGVTARPPTLRVREHPTVRNLGRSRPSRLEQEPGAPLRLVDPVFQQACGRDIAALVAKAMRFAQVSHQLPVIVA